MRSHNRFVVLGLLTTLVLPSTAAGQTTVTVGPMAGVSLARLHGSDVGSQKTRTGFAGGGFLEFGLNRNAAVELQALYVQKGAKANIPGIDGTLKLDYVEIPLLLKGVYVREGSTRIAPNVFVGPAVAFQTTCKVRASSGGTTAEETCDNLGANFKSTDFSVVFGAGVDIGPVAVQGRYDLGLTKVEDETPAADVKTSAWIFTAGFRLPIGSR
jgi:opacity protein-like surface antigen